MAVEATVKATVETVEELTGCYPLEAMKNARAPFSFYRRMNWSEEDALDGPTGLQACELELHFTAQTFAQLTVICARAVSALRGLQQKERDGIFFEKVQIRQTSPDLYEQEVDLYRRMYAVTINYQEEQSYE